MTCLYTMELVYKFEKKQLPADPAGHCFFFVDFTLSHGRYCLMISMHLSGFVFTSLSQKRKTNHPACNN